MDHKPTPLKGLKTSGKRLWTAVLTDFSLDEHETTLLRQACRVADTCDDLQAVVELRQQRLALARLVVALRVPLCEEEQHPQGAPRLQRGALRGVYSGGAA